MSDTLAVIDMQSIFREPSSPWGMACFDTILATIEQLVEVAGESVVYTRFVKPAAVHGAWRTYYRTWSFTDEVPGSWWDLVPPFTGRPSIDVSTFTKWGPALAQRIASDGGDLVLCGVATDCCLLATALGAVDHGVRVRIVADACGAGDDEINRDALALLARRSPLVAITNSTGELAQFAAAAAR